MNYIGIDVHIKSMDFCVVNATKCVSGRHKINTSEKGLVEFVKSVGKPRVVVIEEGCLANWIKDVLEARGEKVVITDPKENRWIGKSTQKNDKLDAEKLARLHCGGYTKEIVHLSGSKRYFKELVMYYHDEVKSRTRLKNKLKAKFRQNGIACSGDSVYKSSSQQKWLNKLPKQEHLSWQVKGLMDQLAFIDEHIQDTLTQIKKEAKKYPELNLLLAIPGISWVNATTIMAFVGEIHRFSNKKKFWMYVGLGMMKRESSEKVYQHHLSIDYNRSLKRVFKMATKASIRSNDSEFKKQYLKLTLEYGILPHRAELSVARSLAATVYGVWKHNQAYDENFKLNLKAA